MINLQPLAARVKKPVTAYGSEFLAINPSDRRNSKENSRSIYDHQGDHRQRCGAVRTSRPKSRRWCTRSQCPAYRRRPELAGGIGSMNMEITRSRAEGDSRSSAKRCGSTRADPTARWREATPERASVSSGRSASGPARQTPVNSGLAASRFRLFRSQRATDNV